MGLPSGLLAFSPAPKHLPRVCLLLGILALLPTKAFCQPAPASPSPQSLTLQEYITELDRCSAALNASSLNPATLHDLRTALPASWTVTAGDTRYSVPTDWLTGPLSLIEKNPGASRDLVLQVLQKLKARRSAAQSLAVSLAPQNASSSRSILNAIMSAGEFRGERGPSWFDVLRARFWSWVMRQLERIFGGVGRAKSIRDIVAWAVIILACLLLLFWTVRFLLRGGVHSDMDLRGATPLSRDWHRWLRDARDAAARGDYRAAIHAAYWAAIVRMEETKSLPEDRSRTPRESLRLVKKESAEYAPLLQLTRRFELVWYGYRSATEADWTDALTQLETLGCLRSSTPAIARS